MKTQRTFLAATALAATCILNLSALGQGALTPPGAPAPTMKSLDQVEPRTIINAANTPGDAGDTFVISQPGSYYLTTNIVGVSLQNGIEIATNNVTLDLNGFALKGGAPNSLDGINILNAQTNITVRNGAIDGWLEQGFDAESANSSDISIEHLNVSHCNFGIALNGNGIVRDCNCGDNLDVGIDVNGGIISGCTAVNNGNDGIDLHNGTVTGCTAEYNGGVGLYCDGGTVTGCKADNNLYAGIDFNGNGGIVTGCVANKNLYGISVFNDCVVTGCVANGNGTNGIITGSVCKVTDCIAAGNTGLGIVTGDNAQITGCHVNGNTLGGIKFSNFSLVRENMVDYQKATTTTPGITMTGNNNRVEGNNITRCGIGLQATSTANLILRNSVSGSTGVAYSIVAGNSVGVIVVPTSSGTISGSSGGGIGSTDPTANFAY